MPTTTTRRKPLVAIVGAACATALCAAVPVYEGLSTDPYFDAGKGVLTVCYGDTRDVEMRTYTPEECSQRLQDQLSDHAAGVVACTPNLPPGPLVAAVSFAYNIGVGKYCKSTTAKRFNAGDFKGGCKAINESDTGKPQWVTAGGIQLKGLVRRRAEERRICEEGL